MRVVTTCDKIFLVFFTFGFIVSCLGVISVKDEVMHPMSDMAFGWLISMGSCGGILVLNGFKILIVNQNEVVQEREVEEV